MARPKDGRKPSEISETASDIQSKRKRGRPTLMSQEQASLADFMQPDRTHRTQMEYHYALRAIGLLVNCEIGECLYPWATWLWGAKSKCKVGKKIRWTVLGQLGRIDDDDELVSMAFDICHAGYTAKQAVEYLRHYRQTQQDKKAMQVVRTLQASKTGSGTGKASPK